jgi:hypothetical protein
MSLAATPKVVIKKRVSVTMKDTETKLIHRPAGLRRQEVMLYLAEWQEQSTAAGTKYDEMKS